MSGWYIAVDQQRFALKCIQLRRLKFVDRVVIIIIEFLYMHCRTAVSRNDAYFHRKYNNFSHWSVFIPIIYIWVI